MSAIATYSFTDKELEDYADYLKTIIVGNLINDGIIMDGKEADVWCKTHTLVIVKKPFWRTVTNLWSQVLPYTNIAWKVVRG